MIETDLFEFAYVPDWYGQLEQLAEMALPEAWRFWGMGFVFQYLLACKRTRGAGFDAEACDMIRLFWDSHIPILMSVKDGYQYLCIDLSPENYGKIYYGVEPEFEDSAEFVCDSFNHLLEMLSSNKKNDILTNFK